MKKLMSAVLGLSLLGGAATVAFGQTNTDKKKAAKKKAKKSTDTDKKAQ